MRKTFYETPTQVLFKEEKEAEKEFGGIAFQNVVICGECGGTFEITEIEILEEFPWLDISDAIIGT